MAKLLSESNKLNLNASEKIFISDLNIDGTYATNNGKRDNAKIALDCSELVVKDSVIEKTCTAYNIFEQKQVVKYPLLSVKVSNISAYNNLQHNVLSLYTFADNATIEISDSNFDLNVATSNVIRLSNYSNANNVTVIFKNINWTYENAPASEDDFTWAGVCLYQPASKDNSLSGNVETLQTWKFVFDNCYYNGEKISDNGFGTHAQALYLYNVGSTNALEDPAKYNLQVEFK